MRITGKGYADLAIAEEPIPAPGRREVLVKVRAVALNYRDTLIVKGAYAFPVKPDLIPLSDDAGDVVAIGPEVKTIAVGDRVTAQAIGDYVAGPFRKQYGANCIGTFGGR